MSPEEIAQRLSRLFYSQTTSCEKPRCSHCHEFDNIVAKVYSLVLEPDEQDQADLELGRMIRALPLCASVRRTDLYLKLGGEWDCTIDGIAQPLSYQTPEEAIQAAIAKQAQIKADLEAEEETDTTAEDEYWRVVREGLK